MIGSSNSSSTSAVDSSSAGWLSGSSLMAAAAGYAGTLWLFSHVQKEAGGRGMTMVHPGILRWVRRVRPIAATIAAMTILGLRAKLSPQSPSFLEELMDFLRRAEDTPACRRFVEDLLAMILVFCGVRCLVAVWRVLSSPLSEKKAYLADRAFELLKDVPAVASRLQKEVSKTEAHLQASLRPGGNEGGLRCLPLDGKAGGELLDEMREIADQERSKWKGGRASGAVYNASDDHHDVTAEAYRMFSHSNPLHPDLWPSSLKFESEVISMTARLLDGGDPGVCGVITSGGTESIILATKAHRDFFREELVGHFRRRQGRHLVKIKSRNDVSVKFARDHFYGALLEQDSIAYRGAEGQPEIVAPTTAHAAIEKACALMKIRLVQVPVDPVSMRANVRATSRAMTANTIMIYASAPTYPHGVIDPIEDLAKLAKQHGCGLHVDCCLGGFVLPFAKSLGHAVAPFDFSVDGVTSISADTHKFGYAPKGTSVALFKNKKLRHRAYFCFPEWTGGLYVTPTIAGSRPGGLTAACWAAMVRTGQRGYEDAVKGIMATVKEIADGVSSIAGLSLVGEPEAMIVCLRGVDGVNIYKVGDRMSHRGWSLNTLQHPPCLHLCVTTCHEGKAEEFLQDLRESTREAAASKGKGDENSTAAIYGMASSMPAGPVNVLLRAYTDITLGS